MNEEDAENVTGSASAQVDCAHSATEFRAKLDRASQATKVTYRQWWIASVIATGQLRRSHRADANKRAAESERHEVNEYMAAKTKHEELSKHLQSYWPSAQTFWKGHGAHEPNLTRLSSPFDWSVKEEKQHSKELARSRSGAETFLEGVRGTVNLLNMSVSKAIKENDEEERHAMSLAAHVDRAAAKCVRQLESFTTSLQNTVANFHKGSKAEESKINGHMKTAVKSFFRGGAVSSKSGHDEKMLGWASETIASDRERSLNGGPKASEIPVGLISVSESNLDSNRDEEDDEEKLRELRSEAAVVNSKLRSAEKTGRVGKALPPDLVANVEQTSEELWGDLSKFKDDDLEEATGGDEAQVARVVAETTQLDDDLVNPKRKETCL